MAVDYRSEISFSIPQRTLPWQPTVVGFIRKIGFRWHSTDVVRVVAHGCRWTQAASGTAGRANSERCSASSFYCILSFPVCRFRAAVLVQLRFSKSRSTTAAESQGSDSRETE